jgi:hypothetical protein
MRCVGNRSSSASQRLLSVESIEIRAGIDERLLIKSSISDDEVLSKSAHMPEGFRLHVCFPLSAAP